MYLSIDAAGRLACHYRAAADRAIRRGDLDTFIRFDARCSYFIRIVRRGRAAAARHSA